MGLKMKDGLLLATPPAAARHGLPFFIVCSEDELTGLTGQLNEAGIKYLVSELKPKDRND